MNIDPYIIIWLAALVVFVIVEAMTTALTTIWFAGGCLVALILAVMHAPIWAQIVAFLIISLVLLAFTRPIANKYFNKSTVKTNAESLVGLEGVVKEQIDNLAATGLVTVKGQDWTARTAENEERIEKDTVVVIEKIEGVKLIVKRKSEA